MRYMKLVLILGLKSSTLVAQHPVEGIWILDRIESETPAPLTVRGLAVQQHYDLLKDDPSLRCEPASLARVYGNPNTRTGIRSEDDKLLVDHELFDLRRVLQPVGSALVPVTGISVFGSQSYELDGDRLRIHSSGHSAGYIRTGTGYPQGEGGSATETFWREGESLMLELVYQDPAMFEGEYRILHRLFATREKAVPAYDCTDADYDWFEQLNSSATEESTP